MSELDPLKDILDAKPQLAESCGYDLAKLAKAAQKFSRGASIIRPTAPRKMLPDHPVGRSVADDDETLRELRKVREKLWKEAGGDVHKLAERARQAAASAGPRRKSVRRKPASGKPNRNPFRSDRGRDMRK